MEEMYDAYRKAKVDTYYETSQHCAFKFVTFEGDLAQNLSNLRDRLVRLQISGTRKTRSPIGWFEDLLFIGGFSYIPKSLKPESADAASQANVDNGVVYSDPWDEWKSVSRDPQKKLTAEFRAVADMTVEMHVVCALWVNLVGEKFDRCLDSCCRGSRLRRIYSSQTSTVTKLQDGDPVPGEFHTQAVGSFEPYFDNYKQWRDGGFHAINSELDAGKRVVAVTMDLAKFYHRIDPRFLIHDEFLEACRFEERTGYALTATEKLFTEQLIVAFELWGKSLPTWQSGDPVGLPVGASAARVMANVLLVEFDRLILEEFAPVYYARYVDDIFLVLRDTNKIKSRQDLINRLDAAIEPLEKMESEDGLRLKLPYAGNSILEFCGNKQRVFFLRGDMGRDFVETIRGKIADVASEWRLMPDLDDMTRSPAARVLTANRTPHEDADALRKADSLSLRRLGFASFLRSMDAAARDLPPKEWKEQRKTRYEFACRHIVTPLRLFDFESYLARLLSIAVECQDWNWADKMIAQLIFTVDELQKHVKINCARSGRLWIAFREHLRESLKLAVYRSMLWSEKDDKKATKLIAEIEKLQPKEVTVDTVFELSMPVAPSAHAKWLWASDLAKRPFKEALLQYDESATAKLSIFAEVGRYPHDAREESDRATLVQQVIPDLLARLPNCQENVLHYPLLYPTRPLTPAEITDCLPELCGNPTKLAAIVRTLRGTRVKASAEDEALLPVSDDASDTAFVIGNKHHRDKSKVAVTSWLVDEESWSGAAVGKPDLSIARYQRLMELANSITKSPWKDKPAYVVFSELSIPRRWLPGLAQHFLRHKISLIAGAEYRQGEQPDTVLNEAKLFLTDNRLGYSHGCVITQQKGLPAHGERDQLRQMFGKTFAPVSPVCHKRVYRHFGFDFGLLVCSELTNVSFRSKFRGRVDALFVLAWNRDLDSFNSLVESTALDVHCYVILANNRKYGDSRVRTPCSQNWRRDLVRLKGGVEDYFVVTEIDIRALREFQSHHEPPTGEDALFKPFPEGFKDNMAKTRKRIPEGKPDKH